jgi:hypothetical protein
MKWMLHWFWAPVRPSENWAQTIVRVLGNLFRCALTLIISGAAVLAIAGYTENRKQQIEHAQARLIQVVASVNSDVSNRGCPPPLPLSVTVRNNSTLTLMSMEIRVSARSPGRSTDLLGYGAQQLQWDYIVPPGYTLQRCYALGRRDIAASNLIFSAEPVSYSIQLRSTEDWMLSETRARQDNQ